MKTLARQTTFPLILLLLVATNALGGDFLIRDGDRVVFLGDSITEQKLYTTYIEGYTLTRYPKWKLTFRNVGWGGDTAWLRQRAHPDEAKLFAADEAAQQKMVEDSVARGLERDVFPLKPTVVTIKFGMNDHSYQAFRPDIFGAYVRSQTQLAKMLEDKGARVAFLTPQPIEENKRPDPNNDVRNQSLRKFSDGLKSVAAKTGATFVDQFDPYMAILLRERANNPPNTIGGGDAVHPGPIGHTVMAWAILKGLGATPLVSRAEVDAGSHKILAAQSCRVENFKAAADVISFDRLDEALPMPIDEKAVAALKLAPILDDLDRYELQVAGLTAANYELKIDGETVGTFSAAELAKGTNLAANAGPITKQTQNVLALVFQKNNLFFNRWRNVQLHDFPDWVKGPEIEAKRRAEVARLDQHIADLESKIDAARQPVVRHFELKAQ